MEHERLHTSFISAVLAMGKNERADVATKCGNYSQVVSVKWKTIFEMFGFEIHAASNSKEAPKCLQPAKLKFLLSF